MKMYHWLLLGGAAVGLYLLWRKQQPTTIVAVTPVQPVLPDSLYFDGGWGAHGFHGGHGGHHGGHGGGHH